MTAQEKRLEAVRLMKSRTKLNSYTQGANRVYFFGKPDNRPGDTRQPGYSDCSSSVARAIKAAAGVDIGANTSAQVRNRNTVGVVVDETDGYYPDEKKLLPGDCLYFKGNTAHTLDVGHVEMYTGPNECCGHGSGTGPVKHDLRAYCKGRATKARRYFMAIRWIQDGAGDGGRRVLRSGMSGSDVAVLQGYLLDLHYDLGRWGADGEFGSATGRAVIAYQTDRDFTADGVVTELIWKTLEADMAQLGDADEEKPEAPQPAGGRIVKSGTWNLRSGPGTSYPVSGITRGGERLEEAEVDGWVPVLFNGEIKWISKKALEE